MTKSELNDLQRRALQAALDGKNVFITGAAGTGKSFLLRSIIEELKKNSVSPGTRDGDRIVVTGSTGLAAVNIGGVTLHSFSGVGGSISSKLSKEELASRVRGDFRARRRWAVCTTLIVDEISQISASFLTKLEFIARKVRPNKFGSRVSKAFGDLQVIFCGDFCQLPPVGVGLNSSAQFCFESAVWKDIFDTGVGEKFVLQEVLRYKTMSELDQQFLKSLHELRFGVVSKDSIDLYHMISKSQSDSLQKDSMELFSTRKSSNRKNAEKLREALKNTPEQYTYEAVDYGENPLLSFFLKDIENTAPRNISLCIGAKVLLTTNLDSASGLVNGSRGVILEFVYDEEEKAHLPVVQFTVAQVCKSIRRKIVPHEFGLKSASLSGECLVSRLQIPLRLGYAMTIHRAQGLEFSSLSVDLTGVFSYGQAYVALSRVTSVGELFVRGFCDKAFQCHPKVKAFYKELTEKSVLMESLGPDVNFELGDVLVEATQSQTSENDTRFRLKRHCGRNLIEESPCKTRLLSGE